MPTRNRSTVIALVAVLCLGLSGCGSDDSSTHGNEPPSGSPTLSVTIAADEVSPNAQEFELGVGEVLRISVQSDRAGELHVHSKPEQFVEFGVGATDTELTLEVPGAVEIEDHDTGDVVALLTVR